MAGYSKHVKLKESACANCKEAKRKDSEQRRRDAGVSPRKDISCGTTSGYDLHRRNKERPCQKCIEALRQYRQKRYGYDDFVPVICGTRGGYEKHRHLNQTPCDKCREANAARVRQRRVTKTLNKSDAYSLDDLFLSYGTKCHICKTEIDLDAPRRVGLDEGWQRGLHVDHLIPISKGGSDTLDNVRPSHGICNLRKSATIV